MANAQDLRPSLDHSSLLKRPELRFVVGIDFGTTFSGFAYAQNKANCDNIYVYQDWPKQIEGHGRPFLKTRSSLLYTRNEGGDYQLQQWGWEAVTEYADSLAKLRKSTTKDQEMDLEDEGRAAGNLVERFKLHLAEQEHGDISAEPLPPGLTVHLVIKDYISCFGEFIIEELQVKFGSHVRNADVQWIILCLQSGPTKLSSR